MIFSRKKRKDESTEFNYYILKLDKNNEAVCPDCGEKVLPGHCCSCGYWWVFDDMSNRRLTNKFLPPMETEELPSNEPYDVT